VACIENNNNEFEKEKPMRKLFLLALAIGVCAPSIMAQESAKDAIYRYYPNLISERPEASKLDGGGVLLNVNARGAASAAKGTAQCRNCPDDDHTKVEIYGGYSFLLQEGFETEVDDINDVLNGRLHFHGADLSATFNFSRYVGAQFDFSIHRRNEDLADFGLLGEAEADIQNYLFGVQVKNNSKDGPWFRPFGHFLAGFSRQRLEFESPLLIPIIGDDEFSFRKNSFALDMGGGIDINLTKNFSIRPIKLDYLPVFVDDFESLGVVFIGRTQHNFRAGAGLVFHF
jgi:opacity protein-like surface antigen